MVVVVVVLDMTSGCSRKLLVSTTVEPPLTANSPQWPPLYNGHCTSLCPGRQAINCFLFKPLNNGHLLTTATVPLKHVPNCQFFSVSDEKVKNDHEI